MGVSKSEIIRMLFNKQLFSGGIAIALGVLIGIVASHLYVPMIQLAYTAADQVIPMELMTKSSDLMRLLIIVGIVFAICMMVLASIINHLKIAQALKLGED